MRCPGRTPAASLEREAQISLQSPNAFLTYLADLGPEIEDSLDRLLPPSSEEPPRLHEAMRYCVLGGGKRIRPALTVLAGETCGADRASLLAPAAALELIHTFSLVHDDLPALDDDDLRRGQPTVHKRYGEALAVLVGDALLTLGVLVLSEQPRDLGAELRAKNVADTARAVSSLGMIGGQADDLAAEGAEVEDAEDLLERIHRRKTGALLEAAALVGANCAGASETLSSALVVLARTLGLMFQIRDDILDVEGDSAALGKTAGKDEAASKLTYPGIYGMDRSKAMLEQHRQAGLELVAGLPRGRAQFLGLIDFLAERAG